jgi:ubiquitin-protein ligase
MDIPSNYPCSPPTVSLYTSIPHPNVFGTKICVDFLEGSGNGIYDEGWVSAYTIEGVLL